MTRLPEARDAARWLLLIHQIPPKPAYFRAKVGRRLHKLGAVAIKNSVYVVPSTEPTREDFQWVVREIVAEGGEATLCRADFVEGLRDDQIESLFQATRDADYSAVAEEARGLSADVPARMAADDERRPEIESGLSRLRKRLDEVAAIDFFGASGRVAAESELAALEAKLRRGDKRVKSEGPGRLHKGDYRRRVWVTRKNIHVDRMASGWLIRRFIDPEARFKFVPGQGYEAKPDELTFDMYEGTFTHVGDACTFETLTARFALREPALATLAEIVHDIDIKDGKFARAEAPGVAALVAGIALAHRDDDRRLEVGGAMLDALFELFQRKRARDGAH
jgi:hypothetical protein